jgi:hypothetical protein
LAWLNAITILMSGATFADAAAAESRMDQIIVST